MKVTVEYEKRRLLEALVDSCLPLNQRTLQRLSEGLGWQKGKEWLLFPDGIAGVVRYYFDLVQELSQQRILQLEGERSLHRRVAASVFCHVSCHIDCGSSAFSEKIIARYLFPRLSSLGSRALFAIADDIWHRCHDASVDWNYYSKRFILMVIYLSAWISLINDGSPDRLLTRNLVQRLVRYPALIRKFKEMLVF